MARNDRRRWLWSPVQLAILWAGMVLAVAAGCSGPPSGNPKLPTPAVTVAPVVERETIDYDEFVGRTEASETVEVRSRVYGYLLEIKFADGDDVEEGQPLFLIEPDEYATIYKQALAKIEVSKSKSGTAKAKHARNERLIKTGAVSREEFDETAAAVIESDAIITAAEADAARAKLDLDYTQIKSPIGGRIDRTFVTRGNFVTGGATGGTLLTRIVKNRPMYVYFDADELALLKYVRRNKPQEGADVSGLRERNIPCHVQLADEPDFPHEGVLDFAENRVEAGTGTIRLRGVLENEDRQITGGMFVRVRVPISDSYQALLVPERAVNTDQGQKYVYVVDEASKAVRREVTLGVLDGSLRIIRSGLKTGERVIVTGQQRVRPGQEVEVRSEQPAERNAAAPLRPIRESIDAPAAANLADSSELKGPIVSREPAETITQAAEPSGDVTAPVEVHKPATSEPMPRKREF